MAGWGVRSGPLSISATAVHRTNHPELPAEGALPWRLGVGQASQRPVTAARGLLVQACWRRAQSSSCTWLAMPWQSPLARGGEAGVRRQ